MKRELSDYTIKLRPQFKQDRSVLRDGWCPYIANLKVDCTFSKRILTPEEAEKTNTMCLHNWRECEDYQRARLQGKRTNLSILIEKVKDEVA